MEEGRGPGKIAPVSTARLFVVRSAVLAAACWMAACTQSEPPPRAHSVLFVSLDTTRADHLTPYGFAEDTTPNLARLAERGVLFEKAYSHVPSTLPAHSTMFTGRLPSEHGVRCNARFRLPQRVVTLPELLRDAGFETGAVVAGFPLERRFGLVQGFETYDDAFAHSAPTSVRPPGRMDVPGHWIGHAYEDFERSADEVTDRALAWLDDREGRWFLFAHYFDPHWPYAPPPGWSGRFSSFYADEIAFTDSELGRLLDAVAKRPERTLVIVTADHGEGLGEHRELLHNRFLYDSTMHVPLIASLEGTFEPGQRIATPVAHFDLFETILDLVGLPTPEGGSGANLLDAVAGRLDEDRELYAETLVHKLERFEGREVRSLRSGRFKLIETIREDRPRPRYELYDFAVDPGERIDASFQRRIEQNRLRERLEGVRGHLEDTAVVPAPIDLDESAKERLRALGYL